MKKQSFFDRLTNAVAETDEYDDLFEDELPAEERQEEVAPQNTAEPRQHPTTNTESWMEARSEEGELGVDVYQTDEHVVVKALVAGVVPNNLDISVSRDMITIKGTREDEREVDEGNYFQKELFWGAFSRTILLPEEVDPEQAEAVEKHGILIVRLPKINKSKSTKLKVKSR